MNSKIGICILTFNSSARIVSCLEAAIRSVEGTPHSIVVVDNASGDDTTDVARHAFPDIEIIQNANNLGYSAGNNVGARKLAAENCEFLAFVNPDVELEATTLSELCGALAADPRAGCAGGVMRDRSGTTGLSYRGEFTLSAALVIYGNLRYLPGVRQLLAGRLAREYARHYLDPNKLRRGDEVVALSGGCVVFKTKAFLEAGTFDERSFLYCEEYMIAHRLRELGYKVIAAPQAAYGHASGSSSAGASRGFLWQHYCASEQIYTREYLGWKMRATLLHAFRTFDRMVWTLAGAIKSVLGHQPGAAH